MPKFAEVQAVCERLLAIGRPVMVHGEPGIGKTQMQYQIAAKRNRPLYVFSAELYDPMDLHGLPVPNMETGITQWMKPGTLPFIGTDLPAGTVFIDEINRANAAMQSALYPLVLERRVGEHVLKPGCDIVAAGNRKIDKSGINAMQRALNTRFTHTDLEPDLESWIAGHALNNPNPATADLIAFLRLKERAANRLERMFSVDPASLPADCRSYPNPRSWSAVIDMIAEADETIRFLMLAGTVGEAAASDLCGFLAIKGELPSMAEVATDPANAKLPSSPAGLFAVAGMVAFNADPRNFGNVLSYAARLGREFEIMVAVDATRRDKSLCETAAFVQFSIANKELTIG